MMTESFDDRAERMVDVGWNEVEATFDLGPLPTEEEIHQVEIMLGVLEGKEE